MTQVPEDVKHLTLREMVDGFGVPEHTARFMIAIEKGETDGCIVIQEDDTALEIVPEEGAAKLNRQLGCDRRKVLPKETG